MITRAIATTEKANLAVGCFWGMQCICLVTRSLDLTRAGRCPGQLAFAVVAYRSISWSAITLRSLPT